MNKMEISKRDKTSKKKTKISGAYKRKKIH